MPTLSPCFPAKFPQANHTIPLIDRAEDSCFIVGVTGWEGTSGKDGTSDKDGPNEGGSTDKDGVSSDEDGVPIEEDGVADGEGSGTDEVGVGSRDAVGFMHRSDCTLTTPPATVVGFHTNQYLISYRVCTNKASFGFGEKLSVSISTPFFYHSSSLGRGGKQVQNDLMRKVEFY